MPIASSVPSSSARTSASASDLSRSGGFILKSGPPATASSTVSTRWCGVTSPETASPESFARRSAATAPAVETWHRWSRVPSTRASSTSRDVARSSASRGIPAIPAARTEGASCSRPGPVIPKSSQCSITSQSFAAASRNACVARLVARDPRPVVGERAGARRRHRAHVDERPTAQPLRDRRHDHHLARPRRARRRAHARHDLGAVRRRTRVRHRVHGPEAAGERGVGPRRDRLGLLPAGLSQVDVEVGERGRDEAASRVDRRHARRRVEVRRDRHDPRVAHEHVPDEVHALARIEESPAP